MKYIRTKDGIWQLDNLGCIHHPYNKMPIHKSYLEILKEADTIEELCDVFVFDGFNNEKGNYDDYHLFKTKKECIRGGANYYRRMFGAIWTDKGLIYVAKLNEKGELELL